MRFLILGGTRLSGPFLVRELLKRGHHVTLFHRGNNPSNIPAGVDQIIAPKTSGPPHDRYHLLDFASRFQSARPDVVIHMIAFTRADAETFVAVFKDKAARAVVASSSDVYRVMGIINRTETAELIPVPLKEDAPLRRENSLHGPDQDKRWVEEVVLAEPRLPATILRFAAVYGPGSHRRHEWVKRMLDNRPAIILGTGEATFRFSHGYAEDIGWATALAAMNEASAGRIYNVGEENVPIERHRLEDFARIANWPGKIVEVPDESLPGVSTPPNFAQDWLLDTSKIRVELGYAEISGIRATIEWQKAHPLANFDTKQFDYNAEDQLLSRVQCRYRGRTNKHPSPKGKACRTTNRDSTSPRPTSISRWTASTTPGR